MIGRDPASPLSLPVEQARCLFCADAATETVATGRDYEYATTPDVFWLDRCRGCGVFYIQPRPAAEAMDVIYPSHYYGDNESSGENAFIKRFRDRVENATSVVTREHRKFKLRFSWVR